MSITKQDLKILIEGIESIKKIEKENKNMVHYMGFYLKCSECEANTNCKNSNIISYEGAGCTETNFRINKIKYLLKKIK